MTLAQYLKHIDNEAWCWGTCSELHDSGRIVIGTTHNLADAAQIETALDYEARRNGRRRPQYRADIVREAGTLMEIVLSPVTAAPDRPRYLVQLLQDMPHEEASRWATPENKNKPWWLWKRC